MFLLSQLPQPLFQKLCFVIFGSRLDFGSCQTPQVRPIFESLWAPMTPSPRTSTYSSGTVHTVRGSAPKRACIHVNHSSVKHQNLPDKFDSSVCSSPFLFVLTRGTYL